MNRFKPFPVKCNDSRSLRHLLTLLGPISTFVNGARWYSTIIRNRFRPFTVQSNDPNSINSPKSHFWDIFSHIIGPLNFSRHFWAILGKSMGKSVTINTVTVSSYSEIRQGEMEFYSIPYLLFHIHT